MRTDYRSTGWVLCVVELTPLEFGCSYFSRFILELNGVMFLVVNGVAVNGLSLLEVLIRVRFA